MCYFVFICVFCLLVVPFRLSVPVQLNWLMERLVSEMTYDVLMGTLNPILIHSLWASSPFQRLALVQHSYDRRLKRIIAFHRASVRFRNDQTGRLNKPPHKFRGSTFWSFVSGSRQCLCEMLCPTILQVESQIRSKVQRNQRRWKAVCDGGKTTAGLGAKNF